MLTLEELKKTYLAGTDSVNKLNRTLIMSGIAIVWILRPATEVFDIATLPIYLRVTLSCLCLSFLADLSQALIHSGIWYFVFCRCEKKNQGNIEEHLWWSGVTWFLWSAKVVLTIVAYIYLGSYVHFFDSIKKGFNKEEICIVENQPEPISAIADTTLLQAIKTNQETIIKLLQPKQEELKCNQPKKATTTKTTKKATKKQPLYLPLDTITCDGKEYMIVEKVK